MGEEQETKLLQRSRVQAVIWVCGLYLIYALSTFLLTPGTVAQGLAHLYSAGSSALCLALALMFPHRIQHIYAGLLIVLTLIASQQIQGLMQASTFPLHQSLWLMAHSTLIFVMYGTRRGLGIVAALAAALLVTLRLNWPGNPAVAADWVASILALGACSAASYALMHLIEQHLLVHERATQALRSAQMDALTRLPGRAALNMELQLLLTQPSKTPQPLCLAVCDIDHFKAVNDQWGHQRGDTLLYQFGQRLQALLETSGAVVGRWGGEEFVAILPGKDIFAARTLMESFRESLELHPLARPPVTVSIGLAYAVTGEGNAAQLFQQADSAMYAAKRNGRNQVQVYQPTLADEVDKNPVPERMTT